MRRPPAEPESQAQAISDDSMSSTDSEDETTDTDTDAESDTHSSRKSAIGGSSREDENHVLNNITTLRPTRPLPKRISRPSIVVLGEQGQEPPPAPAD